MTAIQMEQTNCSALSLIPLKLSSLGDLAPLDQWLPVSIFVRIALRGAIRMGSLCMHGCLRDDSPYANQPIHRLGEQMSIDRLPNSYMGFIGCCMNRAMDDSNKFWDCKEKLMNVGMISWHNHQYFKKADDLQHP